MTAAWTVDEADAVAWLLRLPCESVDLCIMDPAYESLEKHRAIGTTTRLKASWFPIFPNARFLLLFQALYTAMRRGAHAYVLVDEDTKPVAIDAATRCGFVFWNALVWDKVSIGMGYHYRRQHEYALFFARGRRCRRLADLSIGDVLRVPRVRGGYPTEKPVELLRVLVRQSSSPGELVIDPFAGSGSTGAAALVEGRRFAGCDVSPAAVDLARARLRACGEAA